MKKYLFLILCFILMTSNVFGASVTSYTENTAPADADVFYLVDDPAGTPANNKISFGTLKTKILDLVNDSINWDDIKNINTDNINWSDFDVPLANVNWDSLYIGNTNVNWDDMSIPSSAVNWDDVALPFETKIGFENPTATDDFFFDEVIDGNVIIQSLYCKTLVGTVDADVTIGGSAINGSSITCTTSGVLDSSLAGTTSGVTGDELKLEIDSVASSPTFLLMKVKGVYVK